MTSSRRHMLERLDAFNDALARQGADPLVTAEEAAKLPTDNLAAIVRLTADRVVTVARALKGVP